MNNITIEEVKDILKCSIDETTNMNEAIERTLQHIYSKGWNDAENSEIKNEVEDLSKRVEALEKQIKEDKEERLKKLEAELAYIKFRCVSPTITNMMFDN